MAAVINRESGLRRQYKFRKNAALITAVLFLLALGAMAVGVFKFNITSTAFIAVCIGVAFFSALFCGAFSKKLPVLRAGVFGEHRAEKLLSKLPQDYFVITNCLVSYEHKKSELDAVVVGKSGVFIVETKYSAGVIKGEFSAKKLLQIKTTDAGNQYEKTIYNPVRQVSTHVYRLANFLRTNGIRTYVQGVVYFANEEAELRLRNIPKDSVALFTKSSGDEKLLNFIKQGKEKLSKQEIEKIISLLSKRH